VVVKRGGLRLITLLLSRSHTLYAQQIILLRGTAAMHPRTIAHSRTTSWKLFLVILEAYNNQSLIIIGSDFNGLFMEDAAHVRIHPLPCIVVTMCVIILRAQ